MSPHKELRFLIPIMPMLHLLTAYGLLAMNPFLEKKILRQRSVSTIGKKKEVPPKPKTPSNRMHLGTRKEERNFITARIIFIMFMIPILVHTPTVMFLSLFHQRGNVEVMTRISELLFSNSNYRHMSIQEVDNFIFSNLHSFLKNKRDEYDGGAKDISPDKTEFFVDISTFEQDIVSKVRASILRNINKEDSRHQNIQDHCTSSEETSSCTIPTFTSHITPSNEYNVENLKGIQINQVTIDFLMPCHSTPFYSYLHHYNLHDYYFNYYQEINGLKPSISSETELKPKLEPNKELTDTSDSSFIDLKQEASNILKKRSNIFTFVNQWADYIHYFYCYYFEPSRLLDLQFKYDIETKLFGQLNTLDENGIRKRSIKQFYLKLFNIREEILRALLFLPKSFPLLHQSPISGVNVASSASSPLLLLLRFLDCSPQGRRSSQGSISDQYLQDPIGFFSKAYQDLTRDIEVNPNGTAENETSEESKNESDEEGDKSRCSSSRYYFEYINTLNSFGDAENGFQDNYQSLNPSPVRYVKKRLILVYSEQNHLLKSWLKSRKFKLLNRIWNSFFILDKDVCKTDPSRDKSEEEDYIEKNYDENVNKISSNNIFKKQENHIPNTRKEEHPQENIYIYGT